MQVLETLERRVLGALRLMDGVTNAPIERTLQIEGTGSESAGVRVTRNRSGLYVICAAPGFEDYITAFNAPPALPLVGSVSVTLTVSDPDGEYLPRRRSLLLPRDPDAPNLADSLYQPLDVMLYPSPAAPTGQTRALIRVVVRQDGTGTPLAGALLKVQWGDAPVHTARSMTDARGESLVAVAGIPVLITNAGAGAVSTTEVDATLQAIYDPTSDTNLPPDPDALEAKPGLPNKTISIQLTAGRTLTTSLSLILP